YPDLGFDGANFLVVWEDLGGGNLDIGGARVTPGGTVLDTGGIVVSQAADDQESPALGFDGASFIVAWEDYRSGSSDIYGARVTPAGVVFDEGPVVRQEGNQLYPALARGSSSQMFLVYQGWVGTVGGKTYNTDRIWGKMDPSPAIAEITKPEARMTNSEATIVRGVLRLETSLSASSSTSWLIDVAGRNVLDLHPGANDVSRLAPGVYFVRDEGRGAGDGGRTRKVVIQH
ncbi:MAG: hypothetical protein NTX53_01030, partial [candidate division WOR-3 bacterium]|nr:hypothetical protein [candidate division WOR-3 bacterium]